MKRRTDWQEYGQDIRVHEEVTSKESGQEEEEEKIGKELGQDEQEERSLRNLCRISRSIYNLLATSDGHTFVYSLLRYRYRYIVSNGRY
jgi:hypothetical protein